MSVVRITGLAQKKGLLKADWGAAEPQPSMEGEAAYRWLSSDSEDGVYAEVPGAYRSSLPLDASSVNKYFKVEAAVGAGEERQTFRSEPAGPVEDVEGNPNTDWLLKARYGVSHHLLAEFMNRVAAAPEDKWQPGESWNDVIDGFDVDDYVRQVVATGAGFVILTIGQNSGYLLSPNETYDRIAGLRPGERASVRDLPMEIADALSAHGIKLILYLPANPPSKAHREDGDCAINKAFDYPVEVAPSQEAQLKWQAVIKEWSDRYGDKLAGWWFDGMWFQAAYNDLSQRQNWYSLVSAAKSGNDSRIVAFNPGIGSNLLMNSTFEDYSAGETNEIGPLPETDRWANKDNGVQWFNWTFLGEFVPDLAGWGNTGLSWPTEKLVHWAMEVVSRQGVIALDIHVNRFGRIDQRQMEQMKALKYSLDSLT